MSREINHRSIREPGWHPRRNQTFDWLAREELKFRIKILFPPGRRDELIRREGLNPKDYPK